MLLGVIADHFTGASDIANTLARGHGASPGLHVVQYLGVPDRPAAPSVQAGVVALKSRSIPADRAVAQSLAALDWLLAQGCKQVVFKYCSTFDSTPQGNIGPVAMALADRLGARGVVVCPAFPTMGRTIYQGHLFVGDRLLSESGMQDHPLTPMTDPDLRRWLGRQGTGPVGLVPLCVVRQGAAAIWIPTGKPASSKPARTAQAGMPTTLCGAVYGRTPARNSRPAGDRSSAAITGATPETGVTSSA